uniref:Uncharacterized protein n=1 Tax=Molossus molossus TaxID=27622 RepID=A0A7J8FRN7_MOLMO|nr:hypothetical protein HJG59_008321 [Molossus molossus]
MTRRRRLICSSLLLKVVSCLKDTSLGHVPCGWVCVVCMFFFYLFFIFFIIIIFFNPHPRTFFHFFVQTEWEGERGREREGNIDVKGTHRVAATCTTNQGRGQTATEVHALSRNRTRASPDRRWTLTAEPNRPGRVHVLSQHSVSSYVFQALGKTFYPDHLTLS